MLVTVVTLSVPPAKSSSPLFVTVAAVSVPPAKSMFPPFIMLVAVNDFPFRFRLPGVVSSPSIVIVPPGVPDMSTASVNTG